jgi:UDP-N-acetylmuramyl pentapeptide synthase
MYLAFKDLANLFADRRGANEPNLLFYTVTDHSKAMQPKGIFIPLNKESGELSEAIANGAIAAIWDKSETLPQYTPGPFPVFFTEDPAEALRKLLQFYLEKLDGETEKIMDITKFDFLNKKLLNKNNQTYDIAVMLKRAAVDNKDVLQDRRG